MYVCLRVCVVVCEEQPRKIRGVGSNHHSFFGVFELKWLFAKGKSCGLSAECRRHTNHTDGNDCARSLMFSDKEGMDEKGIELRLRTWLAAGAALGDVSFGMLVVMCFDSCMLVVIACVHFAFIVSCNFTARATRTCTWVLP